jgi:hypothetical protein
MADSSDVWQARRAPTCRPPSGARGHLDLGPKCLVQTGLTLKSPFNSNGFRPRRKPDWPVYWQPWNGVENLVELVVGLEKLVEVALTVVTVVVARSIVSVSEVFADCEDEPDGE